MPIAILVLALVAYGMVLITYPKARPLALVAGAAVAALVAAAFMLPGPEEIAIAPSELVLDQITVERTARGATVTGRVRNGSALRLRDMTLSIRLHDCADPAAAAETCPIIGEGSAIARPDVPAGQIRAFAAHFAFAGVPPVIGTLRWDLTVADTRATAG